MPFRKFFMFCYIYDHQIASNLSHSCTSFADSGPIPSELGRLSKLGILSLHSNQISGQLPASLGQLSMLTDLQVHGNHLTGNLPKELCLASQLLHISAANNFFTGFIPSELGLAAKLIDLRTYDNFLSRPVSAPLASQTDDSCKCYINSPISVIFIRA